MKIKTILGMIFFSLLCSVLYSEFIWLDIHFLRHENNNNPKGMFRTKDRCLIKTFKIENNHNKALLCRFAQNILNN